MKLTEENKRVIDSKSYEQLLSGWRFAAVGDEGYIFYPDGRLISAAFKVLSEWFDDCVPKEGE